MKRKIACILAFLTGCSWSNAQIHLPEKFDLAKTVAQLDDRVLLLISKISNGQESELSPLEIDELRASASQKYEIATRGDLTSDFLSVEPSMQAFSKANNAAFYVLAFVNKEGFVIDQDFLVELKSVGSSKKMETLWKRNFEFTKMLAASKDLSGAERIKSLDKALSYLSIQNAVKFHRNIVEEIITGDSTNDLGLKARYEDFITKSLAKEKPRDSPKILERLRKLPPTATSDEVMAVIDNFLLEKDLSAYDRQFAMMRKFLLLRKAGRKDEALKTINSVIEADPSSKITENAKNILEKYMSEPQGQTDAPPSESK